MSCQGHLLYVKCFVTDNLIGCSAEDAVKSPILFEGFSPITNSLFQKHFLSLKVASNHSEVLPNPGRQT